MKMAINRRLTLLRQEKKISQRQAARDLGISQALLSHYENGARKPSLQFICDVCDYYGVTSDYLLGRSFSRDGAVILAEDVPSAAGDNVLRGLASAMMQKKMIINATGILFDILGRPRKNELVKAAAQYISLTYYKLFRLMYASNKALPDNAFAVDSLIYQQVADSQLKTAEAELAVRLSELSEPLNVSFETLAEEFPHFNTSLLSVLNNAGRVTPSGQPLPAAKRTK
ncbi:MAG: helix-turn-helix transcriptional regulator [Oscillospiraceae bacterium]|nr:helix-turn-helix transcriptional regulator [Oscillospiraceae bacterium]